MRPHRSGDISPEIQDDVPLRATVGFAAIGTTLPLHIEIARLRQLLAQQRIEARLAIMEANTDSLSGLLNKRGLHKTLKLEQQMLDNGASVGGLILSIDMTRLKNINDTYGHSAGDLAIKTFAEAIKSLKLRKGDIKGRNGGDEFLIALTNINAEKAEQIVAKINSAIREVSFLFEGKKLTVGARIGIAHYDNSISVNTAVNTADEREAFVRRHLMPSSHQRATRTL